MSKTIRDYYDYIQKNRNKLSEKERQEWYEFLKLSEGENNE